MSATPLELGAGLSPRPNPSPLGVTALTAPGWTAPGMAPRWGMRGRAPRWRRLSGAEVTKPALALQWVESAFGCEAWPTQPGGLEMRVAQVCDSALGQVGYCELGALGMARTRALTASGREGSLFLWFIESGTLTVISEDREPAHYGAGMVLLSDQAHPLQAHWTQARIHYVSLPRSRLDELLSREDEGALRGVTPVGSMGLAHLFSAQLQVLRQQGALMTAEELDESVALLFGTVDSLLRLALPLRHVSQSEEAQARVKAVYLFLEKNLHRHDLSVEQIAAGVNSSRAQLYRWFQSQPLSVHASLREARLLKSLEYLKQGGGRALSIGAIAYACGFSDQSVFSKVFRQRFGVTPSALRRGDAVLSLS